MSVAHLRAWLVSKRARLTCRSSVATPTRAQEAKRWAQWCSDWDAVESEVFTLFHTRWMWCAITSLMNAGLPEGQDRYVQNYLTRTYVGTVCAAIRREVDSDSRTSSLARCLQVLIDSPHLATRAWFVGEAQQHRGASGSAIHDDEIQRLFDRFSPDGGAYVDPMVAEAALIKLTASAAPIRKYTNKVLAHRDRDGKAADLTPSWVAINDALDAVGVTVTDFYSLRHPAQMLAQVTPSMTLSFVEMFQVPWWVEGWSPPSDRDPWQP